MPIRNLLFDLDHTLLDTYRSEGLAVAETLRNFGVEATDAAVKAFNEINTLFWEALQRKEIERSYLFVARFDALYNRLLGLEKPHPSAAETQDYFETAFSRQHDLMPGAIELVSGLAECYRLFVVSNGSVAVTKPRLRDSGLGQYFEKVFISEEVGADKPNKEFFDFVFAELPDVKREECVIIGDSLTSDILGGINAGIRTIRYNPLGDPPRGDISPDAEVARLSDIPAMLEAMEDGRI